MEALQSKSGDLDLLDNSNKSAAEQECTMEPGYTYRDPVEQTYVEVE